MSRELLRIAVEVDGFQCLPPNPRRLKGLANLIGRLSARLPVAEGDHNTQAGILEARLLVIVAYVYQFHQELYLRWEANSRLYWKLVEWCNGKGDPDFPVFKAMVLPQTESVTDHDDREPTAPSETDLQFESSHPDPTEASVFWVQPLVRLLGRDIAPERFERYLHGVQS